MMEQMKECTSAQLGMLTRTLQPAPAPPVACTELMLIKCKVSVVVVAIFAAKSLSR